MTVVFHGCYRCVAVNEIMKPDEGSALITGVLPNGGIELGTGLPPNEGILPNGDIEPNEGVEPVSWVL